jgi:hypothetical protein
MVGTDNGPFEKTPDVLCGARVNVPTYPFLGTVVDRLMDCVVVANTPVSSPLIGNVASGLGANVLVDKSVQSVAGRVGNDLEADLTMWIQLALTTLTR